MRTIPDIKLIYETFIKAENSANRENRYDGKESFFSASQSGLCTRKKYYDSHPEIPITNHSNTVSNFRMRLGTVVHSDLEKAVQLFSAKSLGKLIEKRKNKVANKKEAFNSKRREEELYSLIETILKQNIKEVYTEQEVFLKKWNVRGHYDAVFEMENGEIHLFDFKTVSAWGYTKKFGRKHNREKFPSIHHELQLATYGLAIREIFGRLDGMFLFYKNKNNSSTKTSEVSPTYLRQAEVYWAEVKIEFEKGKPQRRDGVSPVYPWECDYCNYKDYCQKIDKE